LRELQAGWDVVEVAGKSGVAVRTGTVNLGAISVRVEFIDCADSTIGDYTANRFKLIWNIQDRPRRLTDVSLLCEIVERFVSFRQVDFADRSSRRT
jgi:hypothetical protein